MYEWRVIRPEPSCCIFLSQNSLRFSSGKEIYRQQAAEAFLNGFPASREWTKILDQHSLAY
jgi:hypothetical protein